MMFKMYSVSVGMLLLFLSFVSCTNDDSVAKNTVPNFTINQTVENVLDTIWSLKEVKDLAEDFKKQSGNTSKLVVYIDGTPEETGSDFYAVKVAEDVGTHYVTIYNFTVYSNWDIKYYDAVKDKELTLEEWREILKNKK